jgi:thiamine biosynthesis lipoprotein
MTTTQTWSGVAHERIGTYVHVLVTEPALLDDAEALVLDGLAQLDEACSRFRPDSELAGLTGASGPVSVSPLLAALVGAALDVAAATGGLVDPTLGRHLRAAGYDRTFADVPQDGPEVVRLPAAPGGWRRVRLDGASLAVPPGVELDLGASAKAWAADWLAEQVAALGTGALVNLGGDLAVAGPVPDGGWPVEVSDRPGGTPVQVVAVERGGLATSSTTARAWRRGGRPVHHVLDPRTGECAPGDWACVSVAAASCLEANAASTAAVVLGAAAPAWLARRGHAALLVGRQGTEVRVGGWPT